MKNQIQKLIISRKCSQEYIISTYISIVANNASQVEVALIVENIRKFLLEIKLLIVLNIKTDKHNENTLF